MSASTGGISWPAVLPPAVAVAARRPASWIAAAVAAVLPVWAAWSQSPPASWVLVAVLACLAAVGDVPTGLLRPGDRSRGDEVGFWTVVRGLWPAAGLCLGAILAGCQAALPAAVAGAALAAAAASVLAIRWCRAKAADAAALVIVIASCAAAASGAPTGSAAARAGVAGLVWLVAAGLSWASWLAVQGSGPLAVLPDATPARRDGELAPVDPLPTSRLLRRWLGRLAMLTALAGMAAWLVPDGTAPLPRILPWAAATAGWFLALAVPQAILQDGVAGAAAWNRLWRTGATTGRRPRLGSARFAAGVVLTHAAVLGWPPLIAAVLSLPSAAASIPPLAIVAGLLIGAGGVAAVVACGTRLGLSRETQFALALAVASAFVMGACHWRTAALSPISPSPPSLGGLGP
ncbi:MAG: hypothetical protein RLZZ111_116 [Planctomycetota bacterium]|jgi:hypothetical protein